MIYFPLTIGAKNNTNTTSISAFGADLSKYDYRPMSKQEFDKQLSASPYLNEWFDNIEELYDTLSEISVPWINNHMSIIDSWNLVYDINLNIDSKLDCWTYVSAIACDINAETIHNNIPCSKWNQYHRLGNEHTLNYVQEKMLTLY